MNKIILQKENIKKFSIVFFLFIFFSTSIEARKYLIIQSTTSTKNSGLLDVIEEIFEKEFAIDIRFVSAGTGQAIINARNGNGDLILVHSLEDEIRFVNEGYGVERHEIMYNDFIIVGPANDPANISNVNSITKAMQNLSRGHSLFLSRDDDSGTHKKEQSLWKLAGITIKENDTWYLRNGLGMGITLNMASELNAYTLSDRGTWLSFKNKGNLEVLFEKDKLLINPYAVIAVNPKKFPNSEYNNSMLFVNWLKSETGKATINNFKINGKQLFFAY